MRRAAVSMIPSNIAEGSLRSTAKDYAKFIRISRGSIGELITQSEIAKRQSYMSNEEHLEINNRLTELSKMLYMLLKKLENKILTLKLNTINLYHF